MTTLLIALLSLASFYFFSLHRGLVVGHDIGLEIVRLVETKEALVSQFYPRLAPDLYFGYGSPLFIFYPPLFLLLTNLVDFAFDNFNHSVKVVIAALGVIGSLFCYAFLRLFSDHRAALLGTVFYVLAPYKFTDIYGRNAFAEYTALSLLPAVYYFLALNFVAHGRDSIGSETGLFFSFVLLSLSHTISLLLAFPFVLLTAVYFHWRVKLGSSRQNPKANRSNRQVSRGKKAAPASPSDGTAPLLKVVAIIILALGGASFYLFPAFFYRDLVQAENLTTGKFYFGRNFIDFAWVFLDRSSYLYQSPLPLVILLYGAIYLLTKRPIFTASPLGWLGLAFSVACLFMMSSPSFFLWNMLPLIRYVQFPWRFFVLLSFFMTWIVAFIADQFLPRYELWVRGAVAASILLLGALHYTQYMGSKTFDATMITPKKILYSNLRATAAAEDLPKAVKKTTKVGISERRRAIESALQDKNGASPIHYTRCQSFPEKTRFEFALFNFSFWTLTVDGVPASRFSDAPLLQTEVPAGEHCVEARLGFLGHQIIGFFSSALSLALFFGFAAWSRRKRAPAAHST